MAHEKTPLARTGPPRHGSPGNQLLRRAGPAVRGLLLLLMLSVGVLISPCYVSASTLHFPGFASTGTLFAIDPDVTIRRINPFAHDKIWQMGKSWGLPPLFLHTEALGQYRRTDFFYPFGLSEESPFRTKLRFNPFFESTWARIPPFDGHSRCLTLYRGRSDLGRDYWGVFPFYGFAYRRYGYDYSSFVLFPLFSETIDDDAHTFRILWPFITYANSPGRKALKIWPIYGKDMIRGDYYNWFFLWPFIQQVRKYPGMPEASSYLAAPFPLYIHQRTNYDYSTDICWPFFRYYKHRCGFERYTLWPFFKYGTGGGREELNIFYLYSSFKDKKKGISHKGSLGGYITVADDEVFTERKFLMMSTIQKRFRKGRLVFARYRFWPFAEYTWDASKGSHFKFPEIVSLKNDWFDLNLGRVLRLIDLRDTPITRELSVLFGLAKRTQRKRIPHIQRPPKPGDDNWAELISGAFNNR